MGVTAVIPLKALATAKGRLATALSAPQRRHVVESMATHVIRTCLRCDAVDEVLVVAGDEEAAELARRLGAEATIVDEGGLAAALSAADQLLATRMATIVVVADLPLVTAEDLVAVVAAAGDEGPAVVIAPTHDGGTGALLRRPPTVIGTGYGLDSARRHQRRADRSGARTVVLQREGLAFDVDTPAQLIARWPRRPTPT